MTEREGDDGGRESECASARESSPLVSCLPKGSHLVGFPTIQITDAMKERSMLGVLVLWDRVRGVSVGRSRVPPCLARQIFSNFPRGGCAYEEALVVYILLTLPSTYCS